ncbi:metal-dependent hydrolase family protein [Aquisalinus flavus]|uniref:Xaa-Pro dipeptidase n=1 Tax=Aquisalinus flavus TaxID=1526572 RepID=A0A8J2Y4P1_9PROT|nr:amidohydrolase family protein [Aquisalinus flavus]MBD0427172.1 amidohydrolase family protein [Aquisalinus flavus]UNE46988.1 amidohydrolase family protein [Aquisalinus flavus]GGC98933.1 Xaa-Pro dipeptidase [Aquisalinus flavus]
MKLISRLMTAAAAICVFTGAAQAQTVFLTADRMVDVETGRLVGNAAVLVEDGKVTFAGDMSTVRLAIPEDATRIDLAGYTIMPGLIDMHVHLTSSADQHGYKGLAISDEMSAIIGVVNAQTTLEAGFTTVRNVGAGSFGDVALRDAINEGMIPGPRMYVSGPPIGITGGHCSDNNLLPEEYGLEGENVADGPWAARSAVRKNVKYGADLIKTCSTGGVLSKGTKVGAPQYTLEELTALTEEAHSHGLKVASHAHGAEGIRNALMAGVDTIEHASFIDDEGIRLARKNGAYLSMDIYVTEYILGEGEAAGILEESLEKERMTGQVQRDNFRKAHEAGVKMVLGTDAGVYPHGQNARQLSRMTGFGMTPAEALQAATVNAADALGKGDTIGRLAPGYFADIIAVEGNPLDDISILESVGFVMKEGVVYKSVD